MRHQVIRTKHELEDLFQALRGVELPMKVYYDRIFPKPSISQRGYLFGIVYKAVGEYIGEADVHVVHEICLEKFNKEYSPLPYNQTVWDYRIKRGSEFDTINIGNYIEWICAFIHTEFGGSVPLPNEV